MKKGTLLLKKLVNEILRVTPLIAVIVPFLFMDSSWHIVVFVTAVLAFALLTMHVVRKSMYPYIDIEELVNKAKESSIGASIALFSVMMFLSVIVLAFVLILTK